MIQTSSFLSLQTLITTRAISGFTANLHKATSTIIGIDEDTVSHLRTLNHTTTQEPSKADQLIRNVLSPFSAFSHTPTGQDLKNTLISASSRIAAAIEPRTAEIFDLHNLFTSIDATLYQLELLVLAEHERRNTALLSFLPTSFSSPDDNDVFVLLSLWTALARGRSSNSISSTENEAVAAQNRDRAQVLAQLSEFYARMSAQTAENMDTLWRVSNELKEFRDGFAAVPLVLREEPIDVIKGVVSQAGRRLNVARRNLEYVESRQRRRVGERPVLLDGW